MKNLFKALALLTIAVLSGCALPQGSGFASEWNIFRPLDDIQNFRGIFTRVSDGEKGFFSTNPKDYIDADGVGVAIPTRYRRGWAISPWAPTSGIVDVRNYDEGDIVKCPYTGKPLRIPNDSDYKAIDVVTK